MLHNDKCTNYIQHIGIGIKPPQLENKHSEGIELIIQISRYLPQSGIKPGASRFIVYLLLESLTTRAVFYKTTAYNLQVTVSF